MRSLQSWAALAAVLMLASSAVAQPGPDEVQMAFDVGGASAYAYPPPFANFTFYVVANPNQDLGAFELKVSVPPDVIVLSALAPGFPPICVSDFCGPTDWSIPVMPCRPAGLVWLVEVQALTLSTAPDRLLCVEALEPSSFDPPTPGYWTCAAGDPVPFGLAPSRYAAIPDGCAVANPSVIANDTASWSSVKTRFEP